MALCAVEEERKHVSVTCVSLYGDSSVEDFFDYLSQLKGSTKPVRLPSKNFSQSSLDYGSYKWGGSLIQSGHPSLQLEQIFIFSKC